MTVLILDENILWSSRLKSGVEGLAHTAIVLGRPTESIAPAEVAIVNLASRVFRSEEWIPKLKAAGIKVVAHAGHKEKPLLLIGHDSGADLVVTNGELTAKLEDVLKRLAAKAGQPSPS